MPRGLFKNAVAAKKSSRKGAGAQCTQRLAGYEKLCYAALYAIWTLQK
jgi:hypothetical protein